jgi:hypothetical protein
MLHELFAFFWTGWSLTWPTQLLALIWIAWLVSWAMALTDTFTPHTVAASARPACAT